MGQALNRLLVVDDDREIRTLLAEQLCQSGFEVTTAADGSEMRRALARAPADLIILDLNLPREDGISLCRDLRTRSNIPIIMLTARSEPIDRVLGLEIGADDYLSKPFEPRELLARVRSVLRRATALPPNLEPSIARLARFAGWTLDFQQRHLIDPGGRIVILSDSDLRLLRLLVEHANCTLTRDQLLALSPGRQVDPTNRAIDLRVSRLRHKFGDRTREGLIKTVRNEGYVLAAAVTFE